MKFRDCNTLNYDQVHRDLAARNILLSSDLTPKVADFGLSRETEVTQTNVTSSNVGPLKWMPPEGSYLQRLKIARLTLR